MEYKKEKIYLGIVKFSIYFLICAFTTYVVGGIETIRYSSYENGYVRPMWALIILLGWYLVLYKIVYKHYMDNYYLLKIREQYTYKKYRERFVSRYHICNADIVAIVVIIIVGLILRVVGFDWGGNATFQPDEPSFVNAVFDILKTHYLYNISNLIYPNQLIVKFVAAVAFVFQKIGYEPGVSTYFLFRFVVAICGTITIFVSFLIGNYFKQHLGVIFSLLVAVYPYYILLAKQTTGDTTSFFFLTVCILISLRFMETQRECFLLGMCFCAALATMEKWHGAVGIGYIGILLFYNYIYQVGFDVHYLWDLIKRGARALIYYFLSILLIAPNIVLYPQKTIYDGILSVTFGWSESYCPTYIDKLIYYLKNPYEHIGGILLILAVGIGLIYLIKRWQKSYFVISLGLIKLLILCAMNRCYFRWECEFIYSLLFVISIGIYELLIISKFSGKIIGSVIISVIVLEFLMSSSIISVVASRNNQDTRMAQERDFSKIGASISNTLSQYYTRYNACGMEEEEYSIANLGVVDWDVFFAEHNDRLVRLNNNYEYVALNRTSEDINGTIFDKYLTPILSYKGVCNDVFWNPVSAIPVSYNDFGIMINDFRLFFAIWEGSYTGIDIDIYYVGGLEQYSE